METEGLERCPWCRSGGEIYRAYHDEEWGVPVRDDRKQFEFLVLESAQAGLSWLTILKRREGYRRAYAGFDPDVIAGWGEPEASRLVADEGIIRNRAKIASSIGNARKFIEIREEFGTFSRYLWDFVGGSPVRNAWERMEDVPARTALSDRIAADLKRRGFSFLGSTIVYAHLQATGLVNDHLVSCFRYGEVGEA